MQQLATAVHAAPRLARDALRSSHAWLQPLVHHHATTRAEAAAAAPARRTAPRQLLRQALPPLMLLLLLLLLEAVDHTMAHGMASGAHVHACTHV
eukprot:366577-Chlamydomonas_euryale.AAC.3